MASARALTNFGVTFLRRMFAGGASHQGSPAIPILLDHTAAANVTTGNTALITFVLKGGTLQNDGDQLYIRGTFTQAANANNKSEALTFGAITASSRGPSADNNLTVMLEGWVTRTGAATQLIEGCATTSGGNAVVYTGASAGTETLSGDINIKLFGQSGTASNDVLSRSLYVEYRPVGTYV